MFRKKEAQSSDDKKLAQDKSTQLEATISQNIVVHKMPKHYKAGTFSYDDYFGNNFEKKAGETDQSSDAHVKGKKTGLIIIVVGVIVIGLLAYGAFAYLKNPDQFNFSFLFPSKDTVSEDVVPIRPVVTTPTIVPTTTPEIVATTTATSTPVTTTSTPEIVVSTAIVDTDIDGLSDLEEADLGTNASSIDSDGDKYNDLTELVGGYNPAGSGKLIDNTNIKKYSNASYKYNILYPNAWQLYLVDKGASVIFTAEDQSFVQVVTQANTNKLSIKKWYETEFSTTALDSQTVTFNNWEGIKSVDGLIVYLTNQTSNNIYIVSYTPVSDQTLSYNNIFGAMIKSFTIVK